MDNIQNELEKISPVSIRLSADGRKKLNLLLKKSGCKSQKEFIETLLQMYETSGLHKLANETVSNIKLILQRNNWISINEENRYHEPELLNFEGVCIYAPQQPNKMIKLSTTTTEVANSIKLDYYLSDDLDLSRYLYQDTLFAYYSYTDQKYIVVEFFYIYQFLSENEILDMYKVANGFKTMGAEVGSTLVCYQNKYTFIKFSEFVSMMKPYFNTSDRINIDFAVQNHRLNTNKR